MEPIRVGLLEFGDLPFGSLVDVAHLADELGYSRFWLAEHAGSPAYESSLLATPIVTGMTSRIRVGPAGVLIRYYAPAAVARDALFLETLFGRIDLGLAAGVIPGDQEAHFVDGRANVRTRERADGGMEAVARWLSTHGAEEQRPELWMLGASDSLDRAALAARLDAHFALSLLHKNPPPSPASIHAYREQCAKLGKPPGNTLAALPLACVESEKDRHAHVMPFGGVVVPPFVDTPARCRERLEEVCATYDVREVVLLECSQDFDRRCASIQMLAEAFGGLPGPPAKGKVPSL
jgi:alkanesulfonate monooxygenase SsuD/methylene tetrahydromethanopterin reductase-like flavin-dependent oxidoreductase (luciferase family)